MGLEGILKVIVRKARPRKKLLAGRMIAQKVFRESVPEIVSLRSGVTGIKTGIVTIETDSSSAFQELEGFHRQKLLGAFRAAGLKVREVRVKIGKSAG